MPLFSLPVIALYSKDNYALFSASDTLSAGSLSQVVAIGIAGQQPRGVLTFQGNFASATTAVVEIFGSNTQPTSTAPQNGTVLFTATNLQTFNYTDNLAFAFYWAELVSQSGGGALTLMVSVA